MTVFAARWNPSRIANRAKRITIDQTFLPWLKKKRIRHILIGVSVFFRCPLKELFPRFGDLTCNRVPFMDVHSITHVQRR